jgi:hypothetical protein
MDLQKIWPADGISKEDGSYLIEKEIEIIMP